MNRPEVGKISGCDYSTLNSYNQNYYGNALASLSPSLSQVISAETIIMPGYGAPTYGELRTFNNDNSDYMSLNSAYNCKQNCQRY